MQSTGYMNAHAPNDPKLASVVPVLERRMLVRSHLVAAVTIMRTCRAFALLAVRHAHVAIEAAKTLTCARRSIAIDHSSDVCWPKRCSLKASKVHVNHIDFTDFYHHQTVVLHPAFRTPLPS